MRKHPRLSPLVIRTKFRTHHSEGNGYLTNLSVGGAFLATEEPLHAEEAVDLSITLPWDLGTVAATAKVVWLTTEADGMNKQVPAGGGLVFSHLPPQTEEKLRSYMQKFADIAALIDAD